MNSATLTWKVEYTLLQVRTVSVGGSHISFPLGVVTETEGKKW